MASSCTSPASTMPLSLFDGLRTDFSLARLAHYTGTAPEHFQRFVLLTNYHRYIDEFVDWAAEQIGQGFYTGLAGAGGLMLDRRAENAALPAQRDNLAAAPDASLSSDGSRPDGHHPGQHRRRPVERRRRSPITSRCSGPRPG